MQLAKMDIRAEVNEKIKSAIKAKLMEMGAFVDEELPDYIMVMVNNKRNRNQIQDDLQLFLGSSTEKFTNWLEQVISKLEEVSSSAGKESTTTKAEGKKKRSKDSSGERESKKTKKRKSSTLDSKEEGGSKKHAGKDASPVNRNKKIRLDDDEKDKPGAAEPESVQNSSDNASETVQSERKDAAPGSEKPKPVMMQSDDDDDDEDFLNIKADAEAEALLEAELPEEKIAREKSPVKDTPAKSEVVPETKPDKPVSAVSIADKTDDRPRPLHSRITVDAESSPEISTAVVRPSHIALRRDKFDNSMRVRQLREVKIEESGGSLRLKRTLDSAVEKVPKKRLLLSRVVTPHRDVKSKVEEEEEEYDPLNPAVGTVASIVRVKPRPKIAARLQAPKALLLKAVADAHKSVANSAKRGESTQQRHPVELQTKKFREKIAVTVDNMSEDTGNTENAMLEVETEEGNSRIDEQYADGPDEPYIPEPLSPVNTRLLNDRALNPQFFVTLHGLEKSRFKKTDKATEEESDEPREIEIALEQQEDEDEDNEGTQRKRRSPIHFTLTTTTKSSSQLPLPAAANISLDDLVKAKLSGERCRFWPGCRQGEKCPYHHPNTPCKSFPNCKFADKCLFIHPNCKYDASCTRRDCPYTHASPRAIFTSPTAVSVPVRSTSVCRFFPKCANPACGFLHPKPCRYGQFCTKRGCTYQHDPKIPTVNQLKWSSSLRAN